MSNKDYIENEILCLNDRLGEISIWSSDNRDLLADQIVEINNQVEIMQFKVAHNGHDFIGNHCIQCEEKDGEMRSEIL
jgi:hypothetical protein